MFTFRCLHFHCYFWDAPQYASQTIKFTIIASKQFVILYLKNLIESPAPLFFCPLPGADLAVVVISVFLFLCLPVFVCLLACLLVCLFVCLFDLPPALPWIPSSCCRLRLCLRSCRASRSRRAISAASAGPAAAATLSPRPPQSAAFAALAMPGCSAGMSLQAAPLHSGTSGTAC